MHIFCAFVTTNQLSGACFIISSNGGPMMYVMVMVYVTTTHTSSFFSTRLRIHIIKSVNTLRDQNTCT